MRRFELIEGNSSKFWEISRDGCTYTARYGRIGSAGQSTSKTAVSEVKAQAEVDKLVKEKTGKGYAEVSAAASTSVPSAATVVVAKAVSMTPAPAPESIPVPVAAVAVVAPDISSAQPEPPGQFKFSARWRELLPIQRGFDHPALPAVTDALFELLPRLAATDEQRHRWSLNASGLDQLCELYPYAQLYTRESLQQRDQPRWVAALRIGVLLYDQGSYNSALPRLTQLCIALHGIAFALDCYVETFVHCNSVGQSFLHRMQHAPGSAELAGALAACPEAEYQSLLRAWRERTNADPAQSFVLGMIFNTDPQMVAAALQVADLKNSWSLLSATGLSCAVLTLEQADQLLKAASLDGDVGTARLALNLVRLHGAAAIPTLGRLYDRQSAAPQRSVLADILEACEHPQAFAELLERIEHKEVRPAIDRFARDWPYAALKAALHGVARSRNKAAEAWLTRMLAAHVALADALRRDLDGAALALFTRLSGKLAQVEEAPAEALPALLRDPPWLKPQPKGPRPELPQRALPRPAMNWPEGLQEQWQKLWPSYERGTDPSKHHGRMAGALKDLGLPRELWMLLIKGELTHLDEHRAMLARMEVERREYWSRRDLRDLSKLSPNLRILLWNELPAFANYSWESSLQPDGLVGLYGLDVLPGLLKFTADYLDAGLAAALPVAAAPFASWAALGLKGKKARPAALAWLRQHPELATTVLLQQAQAKDKKPSERELAENALRWLNQHLPRARLQQGAEHWGEAGSALLQLIADADPLAVLPQKPRSMPAFFLPGGYARPRLREGGGLPANALNHLGTLLQVSTLESPYAGLHPLREALDPGSLDEFAWDLFQSWYQSGAAPKESWAYTAMGLIGGELCVRRLTPLIRQWPGESQHARAVTGLDILSSIGTDLALMNLNGIAQKLKFKGLQERARERIQAIADARELTPEELADRLVPDLDLDEQGSTVLDFGPRQFTVGFDEQLRPFVRSADGARLKELPKPLKSDDTEKAKAASERWKGLKNDVKSIASNQLQRLEAAMCSGRTFAAPVFRQFFVTHPLLQHLVRRLLWGVKAADGTLSGFRIAEDQSYAERDDQGFEVADDAVICLPHPLALTEADLAGFGQIFADYEILQPFVQLGREVFKMTEAELSSSTTERFKGKQVAIGSVYGLQHRGWRSGGAQDGGWVGWFEKPLPGGLLAAIDLDPGAAVGDSSYAPKQTLGELSLHRDRGQSQKISFSTLDPIARSELLRDLDRLAVLLE